MLGKIKQWIWIILSVGMLGGFYLQDVLHEFFARKEIICLKNEYSFDNDFVHYSLMWCERKKDISSGEHSGKFLAADCFNPGSGKIFDSQMIVLKQKRRLMNGPQKALSWRGLGSPIKWAQSHSLVIWFTDRFGKSYRKALDFPPVNSKWFQNRSCNMDNTFFFVERDNEETEMDLLTDFDSVEDLVYNVDYYEKRNEVFTEDVQCASEVEDGRTRIRGPDDKYVYRYFEPEETDIGLIYQDKLGLIRKAKSCSVFDAMKESLKVLSGKRWLEKYEGKVIEGVGYANKENSICVWLGPNHSSVNITGEDYEVEFPSDQKSGKLVRYKGTVVKMEDKSYMSSRKGVTRWVEDYDLYLDGNFYPILDPKKYFRENRGYDGNDISKFPDTSKSLNEHQLVYSDNLLGQSVNVKRSTVKSKSGKGFFSFYEPKRANIFFESCRDGQGKKTESCSVFEAIRNDFQNFSQTDWDTKYAGKWITGFGFAGREDLMGVWVKQNPFEAIYLMLDGVSREFYEENMQRKYLGYEGVIRKMVKSERQNIHYLYLEGRFWINDKG